MTDQGPSWDYATAFVTPAPLFHFCAILFGISSLQPFLLRPSIGGIPVWANYSSPNSGKRNIQRVLQTSSVSLPHPHGQINKLKYVRFIRTANI